ncbi:MAG TPA: DUF3488 and transglutaminase-like domain-containing protein, partial [Actinotalea sp.]
MTARTAPVGGERAWAGGVLVAVAVLSGVWSLSSLVADGPWRSVSVAAVLLLVAVTAASRHRSRSRLAPSGWGLLVAVLLVASLYAGRGTALSVPVPTPESLDRFLRLARSGITAVTDGHIPVEPARGLELLVVCGAVLAFLVADLVALGLGRAGLSGLVVIALWTPAVAFERTPSVLVLLVGGMSFLLLLTVTRPASGGAGRMLGVDTGPALVGAAAVTALALVIGPATAALPFFGSVRLPATWGPAGVGGPLQLSTELDMRSSLAQRSGRPILTYTTESPDIGPLRMYTMADFDGTEWHRGETFGGGLTATSGWLWPSGATEPDPAETDTISIRVGDLAQDHLPIPTGPRHLEIDGSWLYDAGRDEVIGTGRSTQNTSYVVTVARRDLTPDRLRGDVPGALDPQTEAAMLAVPQTPSIADIRATAESIVAGATTTYDRALALQSYFRNVQNFTYSTEVPPAQTQDAVWDFLTARTGYCVQYATAMTVMARMIGIPSRLAIGFLPGRPTEAPGEYVVSGKQAHAWPELYFQDAGWVRFEPTPAEQTGAPPLYADPFAGTFVPPGGIPTSATNRPRGGGIDNAGGGSGGRGSDVTFGTTRISLVQITAVSMGVAVLLAALVLTWMVRHRRNDVTVPDGPVEWWAELRHRLALRGFSWSDATTPRQAAEVVRDFYR